MGVIQTPDYFGNAFAQSFAQSRHYAQQEAERKRQEEANKAIAQMYLESVRQPADAAVAPYQQNATNKIMQANTADSNLSAVNAPITTAPDRLADTRSLRFLSMTPEERAQAGITPEQSAQMNTAMQAEGPINMQQANAGVAQTLAPIASQANSQSQSAEQMLAMAKEKYGTAMFDRLAPIVASGKVPAQAMIAIIEKQVQTAEKQALKQAQNNAYKQAMELMKQGKVDEAKMLIAEYASPDAQGRLFASIGQGAGVHGTVNLANGNVGIVDKQGNIRDTGKPFYSKPDKPKAPTAPTTREINGVTYQWNPSNNTWSPVDVPERPDGGLTKDETGLIARWKDQMTDLRSKYWIKDPIQGTAKWAEGTPPEIIKKHDELQANIDNTVKFADGRRLTSLAVQDISKLKAQGISYEQALDQVVSKQEQMRAKGVDPAIILRKLNELYGKKLGEST